MISSPSPLLRVEGLDKRFPGVRALHNVNLTLGRGEVLAVIGENGAGKSTLMKILAGVLAPDSGEILVDGQPASIDSVRAAARHGIALIPQELNLADNLDVGANIFLGREPRWLWLLDQSRLYQQSQRLLEQVGLDCSPRALVGQLPIGHR